MASLQKGAGLTKYGQTIDRESAHELITGRLAAAKAAAAEAAAQQAVAAGVPPTTAAGLNTMTPAQQQREIARQAREMATARRVAEKARAAAARQARADERERNRMVQTGVRTAGRVITSRAGQDLLRGVFGTLFGRK